MTVFQGVAVFVLTSFLTAHAGIVQAQDDVCPGKDSVPGEAAFVIVRSPVAGAEVESGFTVSGCSSTFESTVNWRLLARSGDEIASGFATGGGVEDPGPFRFVVDYDLAVSELGHLEVFEVDASEGEGFPPGRAVLPLVLLASASRAVQEFPMTPESRFESALARVAELEERLAATDAREETLEPEREGWERRTLRLWSEGEIPLKLSASEPTDAGRMTGESVYYFDEGRLLHVRQPYAQAIFSESGLEGWYDENGRPVPMSDATAAEREAWLTEASRRWLAVFAGTPSAPSWDHLANASYEGILAEPVQLTDGRHDGSPFQPGAASRPTITLVRDVRLVTDLTDEPGQEAVVLLSESAGGSGSRLWVAVVGMREGEPVGLGTALVGDRPQVRGLDVRDGMIQAALVEQGPDDPACCPGQLATRFWMLQGNALAEVASQATGRLSLSVLERREWTLVAYDRSRQAPGPEAITLRVTDGRISGFSGCNRYFADVVESSPGRISVGPVGSTRMACSRERMAAENHFLDRLRRADGYRFSMGKLVLTWKGDDESGSILFDPR